MQNWIIYNKTVTLDGENFGDFHYLKEEINDECFTESKVMNLLGLKRFSPHCSSPLVRKKFRWCYRVHVAMLSSSFQEEDLSVCGFLKSRYKNSRTWCIFSLSWGGLRLSYYQTPPQLMTHHTTSWLSEDIISLKTTNFISEATSDRKKTQKKSCYINNFTWRARVLGHLQFNNRIIFNKVISLYHLCTNGYT